MSRAGRLGLIIPFSLIALLVITMHSCIPSFRMSSKEVDDFFALKKIKGNQHSYKTGFREIHYVGSGDSTKPLVLFVHGSPGSLSAFIDFLADTALIHRALLITTD